MMPVFFVGLAFIVAKIHQKILGSGLVRSLLSPWKHKRCISHDKGIAYMVLYFCNLLGAFAYLMFYDLKPQALSSLLPKEMQCIGLTNPTNQQKSWRGSELDLAILFGLRCFCPTLHAFPGRSECFLGWTTPGTPPRMSQPIDRSVYSYQPIRILRDLQIIFNTSNWSNATVGLQVCLFLILPHVWSKWCNLSSGWFCWSLDWTPPWPYSLARCTPTNTLMIQDCTYDLI